MASEAQVNEYINVQDINTLEKWRAWYEKYIESATVGLEDLVGLKWLSAVSLDASEVEECGCDVDASAFGFTLDGQTYVACEDQSDGYRSMLEKIMKVRTSLSNKFEPVRVLCRLDETPGEDILEVIDVMNGKIILSVGTTNTDDYYPSFVSSWRPENLYKNEVE